MLSTSRDRNRVSRWYRPSAAVFPFGTSPWTSDRKKLRSCLMTWTSRMSVTGGGFLAIWGPTVPRVRRLLHRDGHLPGDTRLRGHREVDPREDQHAADGGPPRGDLAEHGKGEQRRSHRFAHDRHRDDGRIEIAQEVVEHSVSHDLRQQRHEDEQSPRRCREAREPDGPG